MVVRYSFEGSIPPKFGHKLRRQKQRFGEIATTVVLDKDEHLLRSGGILLAAVLLGTGLGRVRWRMEQFSQLGNSC